MLDALVALVSELHADAFGLLAFGLLGGLCWALLPARWRADAHLPIAVAAVATLAVAALAWGSGPIIDDYHHAWQGRDGWLAYQAWMWQHWAGRFTATAILSAWPLGGGLVTWYPAMVLLVDAIALAGIVALLWRLLPAAWPAASRRAVVAWLWLALLAGWPSWSEGIAWVSGSVTYTLPVGLACGGFALLLTPAERPARAARGAGIVLCVLACGGSELVAALTALGGLLAAAVAWRNRDARRAWFAAAALAIVAASAVAALAPGNLVRQRGTLAFRAEPLTDAAAAAEAWAAAGFVCGSWWSLPVLAPLLMAAHAAWRRAPPLARPGALAIACLAAALPLAWILCAIPAWGAGWIAPRILTNVWLAVWLLAAVAVIAGAWWCAARPALARRLHAAAAVIAARRRGCALACLAAAGLALPAAIAGWLHLGAVAACLAAALGLALPRAGLAAWCAGSAAALALLGGALWQVLSDLPRLPAHRAAILQRDALCRAAAPGATIRVPLYDPRRYPRTCVMFDIDLPTTGNADMRRWYGLGGLGADIAPWRAAERSGR